MIQPKLEPRSRLAALRDSLTAGLVERDTPIRLVLLAALAGEHLLLIGPPGTAKSAVARKLHDAFRDGQLFERLLTRFTVPEELFGPWSIRGLEQDRYHRQTDQYLPTATVAFLDEIFKGNSAILNSLLTILNEREFDNGPNREPVPLTCLVGASNELPAGPELQALYDRFLLRFRVDPVSQSSFSALLDAETEGAPRPELPLRLARSELKQFRENAATVKVGAAVKELLVALRPFLAEKKIFVSDRRWKKVVSLLKVAAFTDGRDEVSLWDCWLLQHCLWEKPEDVDVIFEWYRARLGASSSLEPERCTRLVVAQEQVLETQRTRREQARGADGELLYDSPEGQGVKKARSKRHAVNENGDKLYERPSSRGGDKTPITEAELKASHFQYDDAKFESYVATKSNWHMVEADNVPRMQPVKYSRHHIEGHVREVEQHISELDTQLSILRGHANSIGAEVEQHLWISPGFSTVAREQIDRQIEKTAALKERLDAVKRGFEALPRSDA